MDDAMEGIPSGEDDAESYKNKIDLKPGIAGFAVDPDLGFVSILVANDDNNDDDQGDNDQAGQYWIPVVISPLDKDRPKSAEALTCVQLAGGLDLGTAILPPDSLAKLVAEEEGSTNANDNVPLSIRLSLTQVTALPNPDANDVNIEEEAQEVVATTPEREQAILDALPKVGKAVQSLPGLKESTTNVVLEAMQRFADSNGMVDRTAFSSILDALRVSNTPSMSLASPLFRLEVSIIDGEGISQATVDTTNPMIALGLAMRYKVTIQVGERDDHKQGGSGVEALLERFPAFRPIQELNEDSRIMEGFIPSMFEKAKLDNDMKSE